MLGAAALLLAASLAGFAASARPAPVAEVREALDRGRFAAADSLAFAHLAAVERAGAEATTLADALDLVVEVLRRSARLREPQSLALARRAFALRDSLLGPGHLDATPSRLTLAHALRESGDQAGSRPHYEDVLATREAALGPDHLEVADALIGMGNWRFVSRDYPGARAAGERALAICEKNGAGESLRAAEALNLLGAAAYWQQDLVAARTFYERGIAIREKRLPAGHPDLAPGYSGLATYYYAVGDYARARQLHERALPLREAAYGPRHHLVAQNLSNLAQTMRRQGDYGMALPTIERSIAIYEEALGPDHPQVATALLVQAEIYRALGNVASAGAAMKRALVIREKSLGADHADLAIPSHNLALLLSGSGDARQALSYYERALTIQERTNGPDHPYVGHMRGNYGLALARCGEPDRALAQASEAERISRQHLRLTARRMSEREALGVAADLNSAQELGLSLAASGVVDRAELLRQAWDVLIRSRTVVLDELAERHRVLRAGSDPEIARRDSARAAAAERLARLVVRSGGARADLEAVAAARESLGAAERALAAMSPAASRSHARAAIGFDQVAAAVLPGNALVAFARYARYDVASQPGPGAPGRIPGVPDSAGAPGRARAEYLGLVLRGGSATPRVFPLGPADSLDALVLAWLEESARGALYKGRSAMGAEAACRAAGEAARRRIWDPIAAALEGAERVFLVPDGALHFVNLAALPTEGGGFLVERGPLLHLLTSERDLVPDPWVEGAEGGLLALGGAAFDTDPSGPLAASAGGTDAPTAFRGARSKCREFEQVRFARLDASEAEAREIATLWRTARPRGGPSDALVLTGASADEASLKRLAPGRGVLHLATHGYFLAGECRGGDEGTRGIGGLVAPAAALASSESPLLFGGLALAGANRRDRAGPDEEDGVLTAEEIAALDLGGVRWAVLSACDTGAGALVADEGVLGLRRAFLIAGARTVVVSLWSVADEPAHRWMAALYRARLERSLSTSEAVRAAILDTLRDRRAAGQSTHPFYWAGFVALGDWR
jgi:CHAT domain-containing protein/tetratricopeptide (TPR) repeat protein